MSTTLRRARAHNGKLEIIHSKSSKPFVSCVFVATNCWNIASKRSSWLFLTMSEAPRGIIDDSSRTRAGTLPLEAQSSGLKIGGIRDR